MSFAMPHEWRLLLGRPHTGQLLILFSIVSLLVASVTLFIVVPENQLLEARLRVLENIITESMLKNQEAMLSAASRIEDSVRQIHADATEVKDLLRQAVEAEASADRQRKELRDLIHSLKREYGGKQQP